MTETIGHMAQTTPRHVPNNVWMIKKGQETLAALPCTFLSFLACFLTFCFIKYIYRLMTYSNFTIYMGFLCRQSLILIRPWLHSPLQRSSKEDLLGDSIQNFIVRDILNLCQEWLGLHVTCNFTSLSLQ